MILANNMTTQGLERELIESRRRLFEDADTNLLGRVFQKLFPHSTNAFILLWLPEQAEDIYWVLTSPESIAVIEIPRNYEDAISQVETKQISVDDYRHKSLSKGAKRKLEIAIILLNMQH